MNERTLEIYDEKAGEYAGLTDSLGERRELEAFAAVLPVGARVLDLGCGPGFYAGWLAAQGHKVEAWDGSAEMVALAAAQPGVTARQARFDALDVVATYDGIWANFSLLHAPRRELPGLLARIRRAGKPGIVFHIGMKLGTGEGPDRIGRFYAYYSEEELEDLLSRAGFSVTQRWHGSGTGLDGSISEYATMLCHG